MAHYKACISRPLISTDKAAELMSVFECDPPAYREAAKCLFVDGITAERAAEKVGYSKRQIERLKVELLKKAVVRLLDRR